jgi:hypothetical protein
MWDEGSPVKLMREPTSMPTHSLRMSTVGASSDESIVFNTARCLAHMSASLHTASSQAEICSSATGIETLLISLLVSVVNGWSNIVVVLAFMRGQADAAASREVLYFHSLIIKMHVDLKDEA